MKDGAGSGTTPPATQYAITATANPGTAGSVTGGGTYNEGATVTLTATPNSGYEFVNWTKAGIEVSTNATYSFTANANAEYVANFEETEEELPITGTRLDITFNGATGFQDSENTNQVQTATAPVITISSDGNNIGISTIDGVKHPYLFKNCSFTISVPEPYRIAGYKLTVKGHNFDQGTITYTAGAQLARSNTATATIEGTTPKTVIATGLNNSEININVGNATAGTAGVIITALEIDYVEEAQAATEYPTPTGDTYTDNYLTSITTTGGDTNIGYSANAHPGQSLVVVPGKVQVERGQTFTMNFVANVAKNTTQGGDGNQVYEDIRWCHASLFTDFDKNFAFDDEAVKFGKENQGNESTVMNITHSITVPNDAVLGESRVRMIYQNAWKEWPANGTAELDKGIVYDIVVEVVEKVDITANAGEGGSVTINGEATGTKRVIKGSEVALAANANDGYRFLNWSNTEGIVSETAEYSFTANSATTLTANFERITYTINVNANPGTAGTATVATGTDPGSSSIEVEPETSVTLTANANDGYNFTGWYNGQDLVSNENPYTFTATASGTYEARFEEEATIPAVDLSGKWFRLKHKDTSVYMNISNTNENTADTSGITTAAKEINKNAQIFYFTKSNDGYKLQARTGYYIKCHAWNANANTTTAAEATELTFESTGNELEYLIKWDNKTQHNNGDERDDYFKVQTVQGSNYIFCDAAPTAAATWVLEEVTLHDVTVTAAGTDGSAAVAVATGTATDKVEHGTSVTLTANANNGYNFTGWYNGEDLVTDANPYTFVLEGNISYEARFEVAAPVTYTITATANPTEGGTVTGGGTYNEGETVTLTATPNSGYEFVNWTNGTTTVSTSATYSFTANANASYVANFQAVTPTFAVTTTANPAEGGTATFTVGTSPEKTSATVTSGTGITLYATANDGYRFVKWTKGGIEVSTNATHNVTITEASNFVANFEEEAATGGGSDTVYNIVTNNATGIVSETSGTLSKVWTYSGSPEITITSSDYTISNRDAAINLRAANYTITVPDVFEIVSYTINFKTSYEATITAGTTSESYTTASSLTFNAENINAESATFSLSMATGRNIQVTSIDMVLRATGYTIRVVAGEGGNAYIGKNATDVATEATITAGEEVTLRAEAANDYNFDGWYDSNGKFISDEPTCTITPNDNMTYTARFYAYLKADKYYRLQCQGSNKYYLSSNINNADNNRLMMNGSNRIFYYGSLINEFNDIDDDIEANQKKLLAYTEGNFVGIEKRATGDYYDVTLLDNRNEISHNVKFNAGTNGNVMISVEYVDENEISTYFYLDGNGTSVGSNTNYINDNSHNWVYEEVTSLPVEIQDVQHATLFAPVALEIPDGVRAYVLDASNINGTSKDIVLTRLNSIIPANTGVILKGNAGTYNFNITTSTDEANAEAAGNAFDGTVARTRVVGDAYILAVREGKVGLYPLAGNSYINPDVQTSSFTNGSHKAYLLVKDDTLGEILKKSTGVRFLYSDEIVTGIQEGILYDGAEGESIYDLQGRKLSEITEPGIYIVNGKKTFIK